MQINTLSHPFSKKHLWYLATVCGFAIGFVGGGEFLKPSHYTWVEWLGASMKILFWVFPAGGAGLGMGLAQWLLIRRVHKNTFFWIPATTIGLIAITGGTLLLTVIVSEFFRESLSTFFRNFPNSFKLLTILSPVAIILGAILQWLMVCHFTKSQSFKELLGIGIGWISAFIMLFVMFGLIGNLVQTRNEILNYLVGVAATIPSGLIFAYSTINILRSPLSESLSL